MSGLLHIGERSEISLFRDKARRGLQANHQRIINRVYVTKNRLVFNSKETIEALAPGGTLSGQGRRQVALDWPASLGRHP
jgi:hypothetical protein